MVYSIKGGTDVQKNISNYIASRPRNIMVDTLLCCRCSRYKSVTQLACSLLLVSLLRDFKRLDNAK